MSNLQNQIEKATSSASERYSETTSLRVFVALIPYVGGSLDLLMSSKGHSIVQERILALIEELRREVAALREDSIDSTYVESEEFFDLVIKAVDAAARTRDREKINTYARILKGALSNQDRREHSPETYLSVLAELTSNELVVAHAIFRQQNDRPQQDENPGQWAMRKGWSDLPQQCGTVPSADLPFILLRLQRSGLIKEWITAFTNDGGPFVVTEAFRKLMQYVEQS